MNTYRIVSRKAQGNSLACLQADCLGKVCHNCQARYYIISWSWKKVLGIWTVSPTAIQSFKFVHSVSSRSNAGHTLVLFSFCGRQNRWPRLIWQMYWFRFSRFQVQALKCMGHLGGIQFSCLIPSLPLGYFDVQDLKNFTRYHFIWDNCS